MCSRNVYCVRILAAGATGAVGAIARVAVSFSQKCNYHNYQNNQCKHQDENNKANLISFFLFHPAVFPVRQFYEGVTGLIDCFVVLTIFKVRHHYLRLNPLGVNVRYGPFKPIAYRNGYVTAFSLRLDFHHDHDAVVVVASSYSPVNAYPGGIFN